MHDGYRALERLFQIIRTLRGPGGCPWDRAQRFEDILSDLVEEAYELEWAATHLDDAAVLDETGDVLFLLCFALVVRAERDADFTLARVAEHAREKIHRRHPHVFGDAHAETPEQSIVHWERIKADERAAAPGTAGALGRIPGNLPAIRRAEKVQERAAAVGFDWPDRAGVLAKLREEIAELERAAADDDRDAIAHELGDVMLAAVNLARFVKLDPEGILDRATSRFVRRFREVERRAHEAGRELTEMSLEEMDAIWEAVKRDGAGGDRPPDGDAADARASAPGDAADKPGPRDDAARPG